MAGGLHPIRFPGESEAYRAARDRLLESEIELRRRLEAVAARRRELPVGGRVEEDYVFDEANAGGVGLAQGSQGFRPRRHLARTARRMYGTGARAASAPARGFPPRAD